MEKYPKAVFENEKISIRFYGTFRNCRPFTSPFYNEINILIFFNWALNSHTKTQRIYICIIGFYKDAFCIPDCGKKEEKDERYKTLLGYLIHNKYLISIGW